MTSSEQGRSRDRRPQLALFLLGLLLVPFCVWSFFANVGLGEAEGFIPAPLRSAALADYRADSPGDRMQNLSIRIIEFVIKDQDPEADDAGARASEVMESLQSPVPSVTARPGDPTSTPTEPSSVPPTATAATSATPTPTATPSRTPTRTPSPTATEPATPGSSPTPSSTASPAPSATPGASPTSCTAPPYIEIVSPNDGEHFTLAQDLPGEAFAFDPDNANPSTCATTPPGTNGQGIPVTATPTPAVEFRVERWNGAAWIQVHYQAQNTPAYCAFTGTPVCELHDLGSGQWPDSTPIQTGLHRLKARVVRDDEGVASGWVSVDFFIDPIPTPSATPSSTPTPSPTTTPTPTATAACAGYSLTGFGDLSNDVWWTLTNGGATAVTIDGIDVEWTLSGSLDKIKLDAVEIWNVGDPTSPASITSGWTGVSRLFSPGASKELRFVFSNSVGGNDFTVTVHFDNGCDIGPVTEGA
jgi:hypothetical protein